MWGVRDQTWAGVGVCNVETGAHGMGRLVVGDCLRICDCHYLLVCGMPSHAVDIFDAFTPFEGL